MADREPHFTKWCLCIWSGSSWALNWTSSSGLKPGTEWSKPCPTGTTNSSQQIFCYSFKDKRRLAMIIAEILIKWSFTFQVRHILKDRKKLRKVIDPELSRGSYTLESIAMFANLASRCIRIESSERPSMAECVKELQTTIYINSKPIGMGMMTFKMVS